MAKDNKLTNKIAFRINETVYALDFDNISWMYSNVYDSYNGGYDAKMVNYSDHSQKDAFTIRFQTEEQANQLVAMFEEYCKLKYNYCDNLCVIKQS